MLPNAFGNGIWEGEQAAPAVNPNDLNLLDDPNFFLDIDEKTLQCLIGNPLVSKRSDGAGPSNPATWETDGYDYEEEEEEEDAEAAATRKKGKRAKLSEAAAAKASREKARRERLNMCFDELSHLCDPSLKGSRGDRISILLDAIRSMKQLRVENNQLRQLNKFLEERVSCYERTQAQTMYQQTIHQQRSQDGALLVGGIGQYAAGMKQEVGHEPGMPAVGWLPAPNITEDQKLRPPAA